jgi:hypothetical protein
MSHDPPESPRSMLDHDAPEGGILAVHFGRSANCSSIGSVVDFLFLSSVAGAAAISAVSVLLSRNAEGDGAEDDATGREGRDEEECD